MKTILYKENEQTKMLNTEDFTYMLDKNTSIVVSWGKTKSDTPNFDVFSPETIEIFVDSSFVFDEFDFSSLMNVNLKVDDNFDKKYFLSTISNIEIHLSLKDISNLEIKKMIDYFKEFSLCIGIRIKYDDEISLRELMKIKLLGIDLVIFDVYEISDNLINKVKMFLGKNFFVNCNFYLNNKNIENLINIIKDFPIFTNSNIIYQLKYDDKIIDLVKTINKENKIGITLKNNYKNIGNNINDISIYEYDSSLFSCVYDFIDKCVYPDLESKEKCSIEFKNIKTINDYWYSKKFEKFRKSILKKLKN